MQSAQACQILSEHGFTRVYNMLGGITAWMQAQYPIDTSFHHISVDVATCGKKSSIDIQPLLLYQTTSCTSCGQATCSGNTILPDVTITLLEETENHTAMLLTYEVNGSTIELNIDKTLLWTYTTATNKGNKTITLVSVEIVTENTTFRFYNLKDVVQHEDYVLTIDTTLVLDSGGYSSALTNMNYTPTTNKGITSFELVEFNSSITLSQQYKKLGEVAKDMAQVYQRSENKTLKQLSSSYYTISTEAKYLSNIVQTQLPEYDQDIRYSVAFLSDDYWSCLWCTLGCMVSYSVACVACCIFTGACCVCVTWVITLGLDVACGLVCLMWQQFHKDKIDYPIESDENEAQNFSPLFSSSFCSGRYSSCLCYAFILARHSCTN